MDQNQQPVRVADVPLGSLQRVGRRRLAQMRIDSEKPGRIGKVLGPAAFRASASIVDARLDGGVERGAIDTSLPAGEDFHHVVSLASFLRTCAPDALRAILAR